jgi:hypothetical protein
MIVIGLIIIVLLLAILKQVEKVNNPSTKHPRGK